MKYFRATSIGEEYEVRRTTGNTKILQGFFVYDKTWDKYRFYHKPNCTFDSDDLIDLARGLREVNDE